MEQPKEVQIHLYFFAFFLCAGSLVLGNVLGLILVSVWGWENLDYNRPGGVALSAVQGAIGAALALGGSDKFLSHARFADFWLRVFIWLLTGSTVGMLLVLAATGRPVAQFFDWRIGSFVANLGAIEAMRRNLKDGF